MYPNPTKFQSPTIKGIKEAILQQHRSTGNLFAFIDFHAHATKKGIFFFGNSLPEDSQVDNVLLAKLVSMNCINFDFLECNFSDDLMTKVDKKGESREGSGRVDIY